MLLLEYNVVAPQSQTSSPCTLSSNLVVESDLPEDKDGANILAISKELVARSLSEMKEGINTSFTKEEVELAQSLEAH